MSSTRFTISLEDLKAIVEKLTHETCTDNPHLPYPDFGCIGFNGLYLCDSEQRYDTTPINTNIFAMTCGDGVHFSLLEITEKIQPIIMTVPCNSGNSIKDNNIIIAENINEFLSLGFYNGWGYLEQLCYDQEWVINFYSKEDMDEDYQNGIEIIFTKKIRSTFGLEHQPLILERLKELEEKYFHLLEFDPEILAYFSENPI